MKTIIITSLLALTTGLTGVLGAPVAIVNSDLTTRGDLKYGSVASGGNDAISVAARNEDYCDDNPLCYPTPLPPKVCLPLRSWDTLQLISLPSRRSVTRTRTGVVHLSVDRSLTSPLLWGLSPMCLI